MENAESDADPRLAEALVFCEERLGPASLRAMENPEIAEYFRERIARSQGIEDAVLGTLHPLAKNDSELAAEFLAHFHSDILRLGRNRIAQQFRRLLDTEDLAQSVLGDVWSIFAEIEFESRSSFLSLLAKRVRWKAQNRVRNLRTAQRREDLQIATPPEDAVASLGAPGPATEVSRAEERSATAAVFEQMSGRDRELLEALAMGKTLHEIAAAHDLELEAARLAVKRAVARFGQLRRNR